MSSPTKYAQEKWTSTGQNDLLQLVSEKAGDIILGGVDYLGIRYGSLAGSSLSSGTQVVSIVTQTGLTAAVPQQTFYVVPSTPVDQAGMYRVSIDMICTTPGTAGTATTTIGWSNGITFSSFTSGYLDLSTVGEMGDNAGNFYAASPQNITLLTTVTGGVGAIYSLRVVLESLILVSSSPNAGVSSLNTLTGDLSLISSDASISITPLGSAINIKAVGGGGGGGPNFSDSEIPSGSIPGTSFMLANNPSPGASLILVWNGLTLENGVGYTLTLGNTITMTDTVQSGDTLVCWYRY
jgi:hypothetical protein